MPTAREILDGLETIANDWRALAIVWHLVLAGWLIALGLGWRPGKRLAASLLAVPLASVSALAWLSDNPFNGTTFAAVAAALVGVALRLPHGPAQISSPWLVVPGLCLVAFGWAYPHFLRTGSWATYLYASPLGLIPCPTLSAVTGLALVMGGLGSRSWTLILASTGLLYGVMGWFHLGVAIDAVLLAGALTLAVTAVSRPGSP
jgi:hypothetical protein